MYGKYKLIMNWYLSNNLKKKKKVLFNVSGVVRSIYSCANNQTCNTTAYLGYSAKIYCCYSINCNDSIRHQSFLTWHGIIFYFLLVCLVYWTIFMLFIQFFYSDSNIEWTEQILSEYILNSLKILVFIKWF